MGHALVLMANWPGHATLATGPRTRTRVAPAALLRRVSDSSANPVFNTENLSTGRLMAHRASRPAGRKCLRGENPGPKSMYDKTCGSESRKRSAEARVRGDHPTGTGMRDKGELCVSMSSGAGSRAVRRQNWNLLAEG